MVFRKGGNSNIETHGSEISIDMGDKRCEDGSLLRWQVEKEASKTAFNMVQCLHDNATYMKLLNIFSEKKLSLLFATYFKEKIYPVVAELIILNWYRRNGTDISQKSIMCCWVPWFSLLEATWPEQGIPLIFEPQEWNLKNGIKELTRKFLLNHNILPQNIRSNPFGILRDIFRVNNGFLNNESSILNNKSRIAVCYREGIDNGKRSDLFWLPDSQIASGQVLVYFDGIVQESVTMKDLSKLEEMEIQWVSLLKGCVPTRNDNFWLPDSKEDLSRFIANDETLPRSLLLERWLLKFSTNLMSRVNYWKAFFESFNININIDITEYGIENIIKNMAMDLVGGVCIGKERSSLRNFPTTDTIENHSSHIFFAWNKDSSNSVSKNKDANDYAIISGHINDKSFYSDKTQNNQKTLLRTDLKLIIGLFDNVSDDNKGPCRQINYFKHMEKLYKKFVNWVIEDDEIGVIIKAKKPMTLQRLNDVDDLIESAKVTGRLLYINEPGVLPSGLSSEIDLAVTVGLILPGTFVELALCGCRVVHYDATNIRPFERELYRWGYEKVIFDDLDRLMVTCKSYKENPAFSSDFGDFSDHIHELDPFRDGRAGERVGNYMRWLLESFDKGNKRDDAIPYANNLYARKWGEDKVIEMTNEVHGFQKQPICTSLRDNNDY
ncbi:MAG: hypothetical protein GY777_24220 [Candidatus Brocadiaceae bacterium]|nr:hypothetical protein [Candidatus Brocadiaceae bacterium]